MRGSRSRRAPTRCRTRSRSTASTAGLGELVAVRLAPPGSKLTARGALDVDVVLPLLHGPYGEDGTVQGLLELADLPYVGSGVVGSAVAMDKMMMKRAFAAAGSPPHGIARSATVHDLDEFLDEVEAELGYPCFVKPANMGSSVGVSKAVDRESLAVACAVALSFDEWILVEEAIVGREIELAVLGDDPPEVSVPGEIVPGDEFYSYADKYEYDDARAPRPGAAHRRGGAPRHGSLAVRGVRGVPLRGDGTRRPVPRGGRPGAASSSTR